MNQSHNSCLFCNEVGGELLYRDAWCRVVLTAEPFPGYCRVIWNAHVVEVSDLDEKERQHLFRVVVACEQVLRDLMRPDKMNLASFGNLVEHLHWHVIPRFKDDSHFPQSVWGQQQRQAVVHKPPEVEALRAALATKLA